MRPMPPSGPAFSLFPNPAVPALPSLDGTIHGHGADRRAPVSQTEGIGGYSPAKPSQINNLALAQWRIFAIGKNMGR
jgi:hypothetical protein